MLIFLYIYVYQRLFLRKFMYINVVMDAEIFQNSHL